MIEKFEGRGAAPGGCERGAELVAYLYGEAAKEEAALFRRHLEACAVCREELTALGGVRAEVGAWRAEALGAIPALNIEEALAPATALRAATSRGRSARAALREFFSLSPLWLRAGAFAATLAVCALLALTLARAEVSWGADGFAFRAGVTEKVVKEEVPVPTQAGYTEEQVKAIVARKVAEAEAQLAAAMQARADERRPEQLVNAGGKKPQQATNPNVTRRMRAPRRSSNGDDSLLAEEENLPRLSDLLSGSY